jgi:hypothetical protein
MKELERNTGVKCKAVQVLVSKINMLVMEGAGVGSA